MSAAERLRSRIGANIADSIAVDRDTGVGGGAAAPTRGVQEFNRHAGLNRIKGAFAIPLERIGPDPEQPRKEFDPVALANLAASLKTRGQLQPIRVRWDEASGRWIVVTGERRWRAAFAAGLTTVQCVEVSAPISAGEILEEQLIENALREDLKPVEQAHAFRTLIDRQGLSYRQLAEKLNISAASVTHALSLLKLPAEIRDQVDAGSLPPTVAYEISKADPADQPRLAAEATARKKTGRRQRWSHATDRVKVTATPLADDVTDDEITEAIRAALAARRKGRERAA